MSIHSGPLREILPGTSGNDVLVGTFEAEASLALAGDDVFYSQGGDDYFDGGAGIDTIFTPITASQVTSYSIDASGKVLLHTAHYTQTILATERIHLDDGLFALDTQAASATDPGGHVWQAAALLRAATGSLPGIAQLSQWTAQADQAVDMAHLAQVLIAQLAPGISNADLVARVYLNIMGSTAPAAVVQQFAADIGAGKDYATQGDALAWAASLNVNADHLLLGQVQPLDASYFHWPAPA